MPVVVMMIDNILSSSRDRYIATAPTSFEIEFLLLPLNHNKTMTQVAPLVSPGDLSTDESIVSFCHYCVALKPGFQNRVFKK